MKKIFNFFVVLSIAFQVNAQDTLLSPQSLKAETFFGFVNLSWNNPQVNSNYLSWENGQIANSIGLTGGGSFSVAAKWDTQQIPEYIGEQIEMISIHTVGLNSEIILKIWTGSNAENLIYTQNLDNLIPNQWFDVFLDTLIPIEPNQIVWVGYEVIQASDDFPASIDSGPAFSGYGDMFFYDNQWSPLSSIGIDGNWSIRAYTGSAEPLLASPTKNISTLLPVENEHNYDHPIQLKAYNNSGNPESITGVLGYNLYRDGIQVNDSPIQSTNYTSEFLENGIYNYGVTAVYDEGESEASEIVVQVGIDYASIQPEDLQVNLAAGETTEIPITITNLLSDTLNWDVTGMAYFISLSDVGGSIDTGGEQTIVATLDASNLEPGYYSQLLVFSFNNVIVPNSYYNILLNVEGEPSLSIEPASIDFGNVDVGTNKTQSIQILNDGQSLISIDSIVSTNTNFLVENLSFELNPFQHIFVPITFNPDSLSTYTEEIVIYTSISAEPYTVEVTGSGSLAAPSYLFTVVTDTNDVELSWLPPGGAGGVNLRWDNGENYTAIGYGTETTFNYGIRFLPEHLEEADGLAALSVSFFPYAESSVFTLQIYTGENAQNLIVSQPVSSYDPYMWNVVNINTPFEIDGSQELWVTFEVYNASGEYPAGCDAGPAVSGFGDLVSQDGVTWESMNNIYGLPYNWNLRLFATDDLSPTNIVEIPRDMNPRENTATLSKAEFYKTLDAPLDPFMTKNLSLSTFDLLGYNVYRNNEQINDDILEELNFTDLNLELGIYEYGVTAVYEEGESPQLTNLVQIGTPEIAFNPESIFVELNAGEIYTDTITITNTGNIDLEWDASSTANFVTLSENAGLLPPGATQEILLTVDATNIGYGIFQVGLYFDINNINNPQVYYPVNLSILGTAAILVTTPEINFGNTQPEESRERTFEAVNIGFDDLEIFNLSVDNEVFSITDSSYTVSIYSSLEIPVIFTPTTTGNFSGNLSFSTNVPGQESIVIPLTGQGYLMPPLNLNASVIDNSAELSWIPPDGGPGDYLQYDDGNIFQSIGINAETSFSVAAKWEPDQLLSKQGKLVASVGFIPASESSSFTIKVWSGSNAEILLVSQLVEDYVPNEWNDIFLTNPVLIEEDETYWFGYEVYQPEFEFPAGCDDGPAVAGYGDLVSLDGVTWEFLSDYGLDYNWNIRAFVAETDASQQPATPIQIVESTYQNQGGKLHSKLVKNISQNLKSGNSSELLGYNLYRNDTLLNSNLLTETSFLDEGLNIGTYTYAVTAVYEAGESAPAGPVEVIIEDPVQMPEGWDYSHTNYSHIIYIPTIEVQAGTPIMSEGDWVGIFYEEDGEELCAGATQWHQGDTLKVIAFGDNPQTPEKEGFEIGEPMTWKAFMEFSGDQQWLDVTYHGGMPNTDGTFDQFGLSMLTSINLLPTSIAETGASKLSIYPNPGNGNFNINSNEPISSLTVMSISGQVIFTQSQISETTFKLGLPNIKKGTYITRIDFENGKQQFEKLIVR